MAKVKVVNRNNGYTGYTIPDSGVRRNFAPRESKNIEIEELRQLSYIPGGEFLLKHYFIIDDKDALSLLNMEVEPEYYYTEEEIRKVLFEGSLDQLEDTLNFAPTGVIELIKQIAVDEELPDTRKRKMIFEKTGFNVDTAININIMMNEEAPAEEEAAAADTKKRKASPATVESSAPKRKAPAPAADKYKVVK